MANVKFTKDKILCIVAMALAVGSYVGERFVENFIIRSSTTYRNSTTCAIFALIFTAVLAVVYFLIAASKDTFFGLLATLIAYKLTPPTMAFLNSYSADIAILYYVVQKMAIVLFILLLIKIYKSQSAEEDKIKIIPLLACMLVVPFFSEIASTIGGYLMSTISETKYFLYGAQFICYTIAMLTILATSLKANYKTLRFVAYFQYVALTINALRKISAVIILLASGAHVSLSYYCWIAIFIVGIALFAFAKNNEKKKQIQ